MQYKMVFAIINTMDRKSIIDGLISKGYHATQLNSIGGFTGKDSICVIVITSESNVEDVIMTMKENSISRKIEVPEDRKAIIENGIDRTELLSAKLSGTVVSVIDVDQFLHINDLFDNI